MFQFYPQYKHLYYAMPSSGLYAKSLRTSPQITSVKPGLDIQRQHLKM